MFESSFATVSPEYIPVNIPINVMPICIVDKNLSGSFARDNATSAPLSPPHPPPVCPSSPPPARSLLYRPAF